jgi:transposase
MKKYRRYSSEFKRRVVEELLSGISTPAQIMRCHEISSGLLYHWKKQHFSNLFADAPNRNAALEERICQLEQLAGKLALENEFLKKAIQKSLAQERNNDSSLPTTATCSRPSKGGAKC